MGGNDRECFSSAECLTFHYRFSKSNNPKQAAQCSARARCATIQVEITKIKLKKQQGPDLLTRERQDRGMPQRRHPWGQRQRWRHQRKWGQPGGKPGAGRRESERQLGGKPGAGRRESERQLGGRLEADRRGSGRQRPWRWRQGGKLGADHRESGRQLGGKLEVGHRESE